jgi:hypothetical protein
MVDSQAVFAHHQANTATKQQPTDAYCSRISRAQSQAIGMQSLCHLCPGESRFKACCALYRIDSDGLHMRQVDDYPAIVSAMTRHAVASATHGHRQVLLTSKGDGCDHISGVCAAYNEGGMAISDTTPDRSRRLEINIARQNEFSL